MSVREEDRQRNCPSRGLGIAAAAIGVGVGAALYYFFNKRSENPDASGSTTNWTYEEPQALRDCFNEDSNSSASETSMSSDYNSNANSDDIDTTDDTDLDQSHTSISDTSVSHTSMDTSMHETFHGFNTSNAEDSYVTISEHTTSDTSVHDTSDTNMSIISSQNDDMNMSYELRTPDRSVEGWETIISPLPVTPDRSQFHFVRIFLERIVRPSPRPARRETAEIQRLAKLREQAFRERSWTLEECSICFEGMLREQEVMALPCTHRFHQPCILPWLQERQTCPNCRKDA